MGRKEDEKIAPHCDFIHVHEQVVKQVMDVMPQGDELQQLAEFFRVFGDSTRIRILYALSQSELCVCDIASLLNMGQSAISHQLRILKQMRLVKFRRDGRERSLFPGRQPHRNNPRPGDGAYRRVEK